MYDERDLIDRGCTCFQNAPCSFCTDTFECDLCGEINYSEDGEGFEERDLGMICLNCIEEDITSFTLSSEERNGGHSARFYINTYQGGRLMFKAIPKI